MDPDCIGDFAHHAAERIDLAYEVPFGNTANRRIAGHLRNQVGIHCDQGGAQPHACAGPRGFAAGMTSANHNYFNRLVHSRC